MRKVSHPSIFFHSTHITVKINSCFTCLILAPSFLSPSFTAQVRPYSLCAVPSLHLLSPPFLWKTDQALLYSTIPVVPASSALSLSLPLFLGLLPIPQPTSFHFCNFVWVGCTTSLPVIRMSFLCCFSPSFYFSPGVLTLWGFYLPPLKGCPFLLFEKKGFQMKWKQLCCPLWTHTIISW